MLKALSILIALGAAFLAGEIADVKLRGSITVVRAPEDMNICAARDQDTGEIIGRWASVKGRCSQSDFLWRRVLFLPVGRQ